MGNGDWVNVDVMTVLETAHSTEFSRSGRVCVESTEPSSMFRSRLTWAAVLGYRTASF